MLSRPSQVSPTTLGSLAGLTGGRTGRPQVSVTGVTVASDGTRPGDLFVAAPGAHVHGARFAAEALAAGAIAVMTDAPGALMLPPRVAALVVTDVRAAVGPVAAAVYGRPSSRLRVLGVTGTSGKTTTTFLMRAGLLAAGRHPGLVGTVGTMIGDDQVNTGFTTPEAPQLQALLAVMAERAVTDVAMEVSSHALALGRAEGIEFAVAGFTNLSQDHLDFHADMEDYFAAKARLFDGRAARAAVVVDDDWGRRMAEIAAARGPVVTVGTGPDAPADWRATDVRVDGSGATHFTVTWPGGTLAAGCAVPGRYNVANALLALAVLHAVDVAPEVAAPAIAGAAVPGRMERVDAGQPYLAIVDYSHKPPAGEWPQRLQRTGDGGRLV
ncbi:MAG: UDP-N-acetylmuramyl-tripeptide synthetase, partial [Jatrophihabitans sp.]